ncbi:MAG: Txe/YoeB family addiction module toxin [Coriobacteriia bacterium]|nr:Txe/YoeB family addiction module toxin [Coriobacteriia bacterium]
MYKVYFTKQALKDLENIKQAGLDSKVKKLINILKDDPFANPPRYEKLVDNLQGFYSRRINLKHRLVYKVEDKNVKVVQLWTHYKHLK